MRVNIEFLSMPVVTKIVGKKTLALDFPGETINDLINQMVNSYGEKLGHFLLDESSQLDRAFMIHLNKKEWVRRDQLNRTLKDGDQVTLMMLVGGG